MLASLLGTALALATALPLAWRWQLGLRRTAAFVAVVALTVGGAISPLPAEVALPAARPLLIWAATLLVGLGVLAYRFYRDPERTAPEQAGAVVSPADGGVLYVRESRGGLLPVASKRGRPYTLRELTKTPLQQEDAVVIGIAMSFLDVHVNRAPVAGRVVLLKHVPGRFGSLRRPEMAFENERATTVIHGALQGAEFDVAVVQIASRLVRQIASFVHQGDEVRLGQRIGVIRFGSQVDLVLPKRPGLEVTVHPGERVVAGRSVLAVLRPMPEEPGCG